MLKRILAFLLMVMIAWPVSAESYGTFHLSDRAPNAAVMVGDITGQTPLDFRRMIIARPEIEVIVLWSDGGNVNSALLLADDIHTRGLNTFIPEGAGCYSACSFLFLAGKGRVVQGELGVHQFYGGEESLASAQHTVSDILEIIGPFNVPQQIVTHMLRTPPEDMYIFALAEIEALELNVLTKSIVTTQEQWEDARSDFRSVIAAYQNPGPPQQTAIASPQPQVSFALYDGVDFYGADVDQIRATDLVQCYAACLANDQCMAITLNTNPRYTTGPNCFLKSGVGRTEFYEMAISGQFRFQGEPTGIMVDGRHVPAATVIALD